MSVIDELYDERNEEELVVKLEEKYDQLRNFNKIKEIPVPDHLAAILRPYQEHGFHWINYLQEIGWGGILADDMGLGKTVQALIISALLQASLWKADSVSGLSNHSDVQLGK